MLKVPEIQGHMYMYILICTCTCMYVYTCMVSYCCTVVCGTCNSRSGHVVGEVYLQVKLNEISNFPRAHRVFKPLVMKRRRKKGRNRESDVGIHNARSYLQMKAHDYWQFLDGELLCGFLHHI